MYNNPSFYGMNPIYMNMNAMPQRIGLLSRLKSGINWGNLLNNTSKTLNLINQAIPIVYQVKPLFQNAKTMFKIADIIKNDNPKQEEAIPEKNRSIKEKEEKTSSSKGPTFFL